MGFFDPKHKGKLHLVQVLLVVSVLGMGGARLLMSNGPTSRADTMALGMGAKSLIIIGYQVFSEPGRWLRRFESLKANFILNIVEVAAWGAVVYMVISSTLKQCDGFKGTSCMLAWGVIALAGNICAVSAVAVFMSYKELRMRRETGPGKGDFESLPGDSDIHPAFINQGTTNRESTNKELTNKGPINQEVTNGELVNRYRRHEETPPSANQSPVMALSIGRKRARCRTGR
ncbi:hypothetical protein EV126DRAFT_525207 [Verticillium dahliae]|nr:hypothetical protein EV126DRAFT_525207 [Verticillium dahliae]